MEPNAAVLLVAHGSRESRANDELRETANRLGGSLPEGVRILPCFLEIEPPTIQDAFEAAVRGGSKSIIAFPYFLSSGIHVLKDIPNILQGCLADFPDVSVSITSSLGPDPRLDGIVIERLLEGGKGLHPESEITNP